ncbi:MAG: beta-ketoacyl synthase N-terminal-like domain-containing protein [Holophaga sp.]|nr:beta-ketoacyl synthase N-terminal-like domain-containing protein [Holophaga sp.]
MRRITLQGIGTFGGFGTGVQALSQALEKGLVAPSIRAVPTGHGATELAAMRADIAPLEALAPARTLRRMDSFSKLALLGARLALEDAGLEPTGNDGLGLVIATGYGATTTTTYALMDSISRDGDACTSPIHFANSMHNTAAANISLQIGATGPNLTISQFHLSVPSALLTARRWLLEGRVERVLFGAVDELSDLMAYLWMRQRGEHWVGPMAPLATQRETAIPGEGAAFFLLSARDEAKPGYCTLQDVATGRYSGALSCDGDLLVLGADGRQAFGATYVATAQDARVACFTPHYGSMPSGPAFDLAAAALMLRRGKAYATPASEACDFAATVLPKDALIAKEEISCLTFAADRGYGRIRLGGL